MWTNFIRASRSAVDFYTIVTKQATFLPIGFNDAEYSENAVSAMSCHILLYSEGSERCSATCKSLQESRDGA